jgi:hypothetical protein
MSKFFKLSVSRSETTDVYLKCNDLMTPRDAMRCPDIGEACHETTDDTDWDNFGWEHDVEVHGCVEVSEEEANQFQVFDTEKGET